MFDSFKYLLSPMSLRVGFRKLEYGPGTIWAGVRSSEAFGVGGQSYSNLLASTVGLWAFVLLAFGVLIGTWNMHFLRGSSFQDDYVAHFCLLLYVNGWMEFEADLASEPGRSYANPT